MLENNNNGLKAKQYLLKRGIDDELIRKFNIGFADDSNNLVNVLKSKNIDLTTAYNLGLINNINNNYYDFFRNRIIFPITDENNNVVAFSGRTINNNDVKYLNSKDTIIFKKNTTIFNLYNAKNYIKEENSVYLFEGFMDVIAAYKCGIYNGIATMGTAFSSNHKDILKKYTNKIIICYDGDSAGVNATKKVINLIKNDFNLEIVTLPENLDPDEYLNKYGKDKLYSYLKNNKQSIYEYEVNSIINQIDRNNLLDFENKKIKLLFYIKDIKSLTLRETLLNIVATKLDININILKIELDKIENRNNYKSNKKIKEINNQTTIKIFEDIPIKEKFESKIMKTILLDNSKLVYYYKSIPGFFCASNKYYDLIKDIDLYLSKNLNTDIKEFLININPDNIKLINNLEKEVISLDDAFCKSLVVAYKIIIMENYLEMEKSLTNIINYMNNIENRKED